MSVYMDAQAEDLMRWLTEQAKADPGYGYQIWLVANEMGWTDSQVRYAISYVRNDSSQSGDVIICKQAGSRWYYRAPSQVEDVEEYLRDSRAQDIAVRLGHVLLMVRKSRVGWGEVDNALPLLQTHLIAAMREMVRMGTPGAAEMLAQALRPIEESNGHAA